MAAPSISEGILRRRLIGTLAALGLALAAGCLADLVVAHATEGRIRDRLPCAARVDITGFPVAPQVLQGTLRRVEVAVDGLVVRDRVLDVEASLRGVPTGGDQHVEHVTLEGTLPWSQAGDLLGGALDGASDTQLGAADGMLAADLTVSTALGEVPATVLSRIEVDGDRVVVSPAFVQLGGRRISVDLLADRGRMGELVAPREFTPALPAGLELTGASAGSTGLVLTAEGSGVDLDALRGDGGGTPACTEGGAR